MIFFFFPVVPSHVNNSVDSMDIMQKKFFFLSNSYCDIGG